MTNTSKQYALALFSLASEKKEIEIIYQELNQLIQGLDDDSFKFFLNPKIENKEKHQVIEKVLNNQLLINFFKALIDNNRFNFVEEILKAYKELLNESQNIGELIVFSNKALSQENKDKLIQKFTKVLNKKIIINEVIQPSIIGGIRIEYQGSVIDQTVDASLEQIKSSLIG
ncbi:ATP synthase F1 subunit delta [Hujiaoplasma nucleasis]|uniref:ATP synthase subunit delta n=1 Tax=Hujiaoplasma nucleasis TaxID=2725268 RepID=A0A7L6N4T6_9MOLU|nr:ATP synthase F1 subunit delta [Hujiaoplasma nucleasis]QLY40258.1 ATP synthase F1 subunit delta [Hujiaoplasma nucleasis]